MTDDDLWALRLAVETLAEGWERRAKYLDRVLDHTEAKVFRKHADDLRAVLASPPTLAQRDTEVAAGGRIPEDMRPRTGASTVALDSLATEEE